MDQKEIENLGKWRLSKYALFTENPNNSNEIFYVNTLFRKFCILTKEEFKLLFNFNNSIIEIKTLNKFIKEKIIVNFDELAYLKAGIINNAYFIKDISITICTTLNCNFDCIYCFEKHRVGKMSLEVQNKSIELIKKTLEITGANKLRIHWFGGEPLLYPDVIDHISKELISFCKEKNIFYTASIMTNGYLLTQEIADLLYNLKVNKYQITIDGIGKTHDYTRHLVNGQGTYDKIIENLKKIKIHGRIDIRNTLHENNKEEANEVKKIINEIKNNTGNDLFYYTALVNYNDNLKNKDNQIKLLSQQIENEKCPKRGFNIPVGTNCSAQNVGRFTIDEKGKLYKCRDELREEYHFGDINTWDPANPILTAENPDMITCYLNSIYGLEDEECRECVWVPFCRGGCAKFRLFYNKKCLPYKNNPDYFVLGVAKYYLKNNLLTNNKI